MSLWTFRTPARNSVPLAERVEEPADRLWMRVKEKQAVALIRLADSTWAEYEAIPQTIEANADYLFGRTDRSTIPAGRGFGLSSDSKGNVLNTPADMGFQSPLRVYRGGHVYTINDTLKTELTSAITTAEPAGYGAYITGPVADTGQRVGDEIMVSGRTAEYEQSV